MFATDDKKITKINALDDGNCFLHGDFHLENVMLDENNQLVVIDMMNVGIKKIFDYNGLQR